MADRKPLSSLSEASTPPAGPLVTCPTTSFTSETVVLFGVRTTRRMGGGAVVSNAGPILIEPPSNFPPSPAGALGNAVIASYALDAPVNYAPNGWVAHLEDLAVVQQHVTSTILVPEAVEPEFANELHPYARMLSGEQLNGTWDEVEARLSPGVSRTTIQAQRDGGGPLAWDRQIAITLGGEDLELGTFTTILMSVRLADEQPEDEGRFGLVPAADNSFIPKGGTA